MITIVAKCLLKTGKKEEFISLVQPLIEGSRNEDGNIAYDLYEDMNNADTVAFIEKWKNQEAINLHNASAHFLAGLAVIKEMSDEIEITNYQQV